MIRFFKRNSRQTSARRDADKAALKVANRLLSLQKRWAEWMHKRTAGLSRRGKTGLMIAVVSVTGGASVTAIFNGFAGDRHKIHQAGTIQRTLLPPADWNSHPLKRDADTLSLLHVRKFRRLLDSLARSPSGVRYRDSLLMSHPGLLDSLSALGRIK